MSEPRSGESQMPEEAELLIQQFLDEELEAAEFERLQAWLKEDPAVRQRYLAVTKFGVLLRNAAGQVEAESGMDEKSAVPVVKAGFPIIPVLLSSVILLLGVLTYGAFRGPGTGAHIVDSADATWLSAELEEGEALPIGSSLQLASGSVEIAFASGALTRVHGPALFEIESENQGFLHYGKAFSTAEDERADGFTIRTASGTFVDRGTQFITQATADGLSQMMVVKGTVDADAAGFERRRILGGSGIGFEPGAMSVMIEIERGTETPEFLFPNIPPPSSRDLASVLPAEIEIDARRLIGQRSEMAPGSAPMDVLINGRAQKNHDDPEESFFFRNDSIGYIIFDLKEKLPISSIHTYSWHRNRSKPDSTLRAVQRFTVWGAGEERPAKVPRKDNPRGWTRIARVDTDVFFRVEGSDDRPPQQACRLVPAEGVLGEFRYLAFQVLPTGSPEIDPPRHTFFSEIDIFVENP